MATHGRAMKIKIGSTSVGSVTDWKRSSNTGKDDVTACEDTAKVYLTGLPDDSGSLSVFWVGSDTGQLALEAAYRAGSSVVLHIYPTGATTNPAYQFTGTVRIDSLSTGGGVASAFTAEFTYVGALLYAQIPA